MTNTQTKSKAYETATIKILEKSAVEITGSIATEVWEGNRKQAIKNINETITVDGFRKGMIPENILISAEEDMLKTQARSLNILNYYLSLGLIGEEARKIKCSLEFMERLSQAKKNWMSI